MSRIRFGRADSIILDGVLYALGSADEDGILIAPVGATTNPRSATHTELLNAYFEGRLKIVRGDLQTLSEEVRRNIGTPLEVFDTRWRAEAEKRLEYVQACDRFFARRLYPRNPRGYGKIAKIVARHRRLCRAQDEGVRSDAVPLEIVSGSAVRAWHRRWRKAARHLCALVPLHDGKGRRGPRLDPEVIAVIEHQIRDRYLILERPPLTLVYQLIVDAVLSRNEKCGSTLAIPSQSSVRRWLKNNIDDYTIVYSRMGRKTAEQEFRHVHRAPLAQRPIATLTNRNGDEDAPAHNVWLTLAICEASRVIAGWHLSNEPPSWTSVMACLGMLIAPKHLERFEVKSEFPVFGVPEVVVMDNGKEFHSSSLKAAAGQLRFELRYTPRTVAHLRRHVERVIGSIKRDFLAFMPGRTFADPHERGDYPSEGRAAYRMSDIERGFARWVVDIYHNRPHRGLAGETPLHRWKNLAQVYGTSLPPDVNDLHAILSVVVDRTVTRKGIEFLGLFYQSNALQAMRRRAGHFGKLHMVKADPNNLGFLLVLDEEKGRWIEVPCASPELANGVTMSEWKETVRLARRSTQSDARVAYSTLLRTRRALAEEGRRKGAKPIRMSKGEIDWFREHVDDPSFHFGTEIGSEQSGSPESTDIEPTPLSIGVRRTNGANGDSRPDKDKDKDEDDDPWTVEFD